MIPNLKQYLRTKRLKKSMSIMATLIRTKTLESRTVILNASCSK